MQIKKESLEALLQLLQYPEDQVSQWLNAKEELDIPLPDDIKVYNAEAYNTLIANTKESVKTGYYRGGQEVMVGKLKEEHGFDFPGKDIHLFLEKYAEKKIAEAGIGPDEARRQWEAEKKQLTDSIGEWKDKYTALQTEKEEVARDAEWLSKFPAQRSMQVADEDRLLLLKNKLARDEDGAYLYKGQPLKDELQNNLPVDKVLEHVFAAENWLTTETPRRDGRGGSNSTLGPGLPTRQSEVAEAWRREGRQPRGAEFQAHLTALVKENPGFELNG